MCKIQTYGASLALNTRVFFSFWIVFLEISYVANAVKISSRVRSACRPFITYSDKLALSLEVGLGLIQSGVAFSWSYTLQKTLGA